MAETMDNFRVIVVGAGPVALSAAHALSQAGIDFVVLERRKALDKDAGSSVAVWPHNVRLLDQLGLLEEAERTYMPVKYKRNLRRDGSELSRSNMLEAIGIKYARPVAPGASMWGCLSLLILSLVTATSGCVSTGRS